MSRIFRYKIKPRNFCPPKPISVEQKFLTMSLIEKIRFFCRAYWLFIAILLAISFFVLVIGIVYMVHLNEVNKDLYNQVKELKQFCDEFAELSKISQERQNEQLKELEKGIEKSYSIAMIPRSKRLSGNIYPRFKKDFGFIPIPDKFSYEKSPAKVRLALSLKLYEHNQYDSTMDQTIKVNKDPPVVRRSVYVKGIPENSNRCDRFVIDATRLRNKII